MVARDRKVIADPRVSVRAIAGTDARHYEPAAKAIYRFLPVRADAGDLKRFHGTDARTAVAAHARAIIFDGAVLDEAER